LRQYPGLRIVPFVGDFERDLGEIPAAKGRRMIAFLGSTIGNLEPPARASLYRNVVGVCGEKCGCARSARRS
jgi:L-histidine Nalpha-methyltransferase